MCCAAVLGNLRSAYESQERANLAQMSLETSFACR